MKRGRLRPDRIFCLRVSSCEVLRDRTGRLRPLRVPGSRGSAHTLPPPRRLWGPSCNGHSRPVPLQLIRGPRIAQTEVAVRNRCARLPVTGRLGTLRRPPPSDTLAARGQRPPSASIRRSLHPVVRIAERRDASVRRETASEGRVQASSRSWPTLYTFPGDVVSRAVEPFAEVACFRPIARHKSDRVVPGFSIA